VEQRIEPTCPDYRFLFPSDREEFEFSAFLGMTPLMIAIKTNTTKLVDLLLKAGADVMSTGSSFCGEDANAFIIACGHGHVGICEQLLNHLEITLSPESIRLLIDLPDRRGNTAVLAFISNFRFILLKNRPDGRAKYVEFLQRLLSWDPELCWQNRDGVDVMTTSDIQDAGIYEIRDILRLADAREDLEHNRME
jgi:hypothetical protein